MTSIKDFSDDGVVEAASYEDLVHIESVLKERTLARIQNAVRRDRSESNLHDKPEINLTAHSRSAEDVDGAEQLTDTLADVRDELFEAIPEPFYQVTDFQRVLITETRDDFLDNDTKLACEGLQACMDIREKWISEHPFPPQDLVPAEEEVCGIAMSSPGRRGNQHKIMLHFL
jgi:hypothetical protein